MSEDSFRIPDYLGHILEAIRRIEEYTEDLTEAAFLAHEQVQDAVIRNIEIMGEAARRIDRHYPDFASQHPEVPWGEMYVMRNRVAHGYFSVDTEIVWKTIRNDLPELAQQVAALLESIKNSPS